MHNPNNTPSEIKSFYKYTLNNWKQVLISTTIVAIVGLLIIYKTSFGPLSSQTIVSGSGMTKADKKAFYQNKKDIVKKLQEVQNSSGNKKQFIIPQQLHDEIIALSDSIIPYEYRHPSTNRQFISPERGELFTLLSKYHLSTHQVLKGGCFDYAKLNKIRINKVDLSDGQFKGVIWENGQLRKSTLVGINMENAILVNFDFSKSNLMLANLSGSDLHGANFTGATMTGMDLSNTSMQNAILNGARFSDVDMTRSNFKGILLDYTNWHNVNARESTLKGAIITKDFTIQNSDFTRANLQVIVKERSSISNTKLTNAILSGSSFSKSSFEGVNVEGADLSKTNLTRTSISQSNLSMANLKYMNAKAIKFTDCNLTCANFTGSNMRDQKRSELDFLELAYYDAYHPNNNDEILKTSFKNSILDYAIFDSANIPEGLTVKSATGTRWPDGYSTATLTITNPNPPDPKLKKIQDQWLNIKE